MRQQSIDQQLLIITVNASVMLHSVNFNAKMNALEGVKLPSCVGVASLKSEIFHYIWLGLYYTEVTCLMVTVLS